MKAFLGSIVLFALVCAPALAQPAAGPEENPGDSLPPLKNPAYLQALVKTDHFDAAATAGVVAPLLNAETVAVVHVDFSRVAVEPIMAMVGRLLPEPESQSRGWAKRLAALRRAGVKDLYFVVSLGGEGVIPNVLVTLPPVPLRDQPDLGGICDALGVPRSWGVQRGAQLFIRLTPFTPLPLDKEPAAGRLEALATLRAGLAAAGDAPVQIVLMPPASARRVIEELVPELPKKIGGGPSTILTQGITWATIGLYPPPQVGGTYVVKSGGGYAITGLDLSPHAALRLTVKSQDAEAARALAAKWLAALNFGREEAGKHAATREYLPQFEKLAARLTPKVEGDRLILNLDEKDHALSDFLGLLGPALRSQGRVHQQMLSMNHLKQIGLAMHNYNDAFKHFPAPASHDRSGKPLLSWRVRILPYLGQGQLYRQFHLDEPWDSPHNKALVEKMPAVFRSPASQAAAGMTNYLVPVGNGALYSSMKDEPTPKDITHGTSITIMTVEADDAHAVVWTKPEDLPFDPADPKKGLSTGYEGGCPVGMCDGSATKLLPKIIDAKDLKALFTRAGGEVIKAKF